MGVYLETGRHNAGQYLGHLVSPFVRTIEGGKIDLRNHAVINVGRQRTGSASDFIAPVQYLSSLDRLAIGTMHLQSAQLIGDKCGRSPAAVAAMNENGNSRRAHPADTIKRCARRCARFAGVLFRKQRWIGASDYILHGMRQFMKLSS